MSRMNCHPNTLHFCYARDSYKCPISRETEPRELAHHLCNFTVFNMGAMICPLGYETGYETQFEDHAHYVSTAQNYIIVVEES